MCIVMCCTFTSAFGTNSLSDVALENLTVVPDSPLSVELEWKVVPTDGHHCIRNYNIQIAGHGSQWEEQIPGSNHSFCFTEIQLLPFQEYMYCVTANLLHGQIVKLTANFTELQGGLKCDQVITMLNQSKLSTSCYSQPSSWSNWACQTNTNCESRYITVISRNTSTLKNKPTLEN